MYAHSAISAFPMIRLRIGIGGESPTLPCHTTGHAGPHPAVRRVELTMSRELGKPGRGEVSVGQSDVQRGGLREVPRSIGTARSLRGLLRSDAALAEFSISCGSSFPLFPDHRPESTSEPLPQFLKHARSKNFSRSRSTTQR